MLCCCRNKGPLLGSMHSCCNSCLSGAPPGTSRVQGDPQDHSGDCPQTETDVEREAKKLKREGCGPSPVKS